MSEYPISKLIDCAIVNRICLTLATWDTGFGPSYEIGFRYGDGDFQLIQWSGISPSKAWDIVKRLTAKGHSPERIMRVLDKIGS